MLHAREPMLTPEGHEYGKEDRCRIVK